jgi:RNA ligase
MGYMHIENLYRNQKILNFKRCYALEKVHGTSTRVSWDAEKAQREAGAKYAGLTFFGGGESNERFAALFDPEVLRDGFVAIGHPKVTVYGEAYGGRQQGMGHTYGPDLRFIAFDVAVGDTWLSVPNMDQVARRLGLEVVPWEETPTDLEALDALRDKPSEVAAWRGMGSDKKREGVVLRPLEEMTTSNGERVICKHKAAGFGERRTPQEVKGVDPDKLAVLARAGEIAEEWVTEERFTHVLDHLSAGGARPAIEDTGKVLSAMVEDVYREAKGEIVESRDAERAIRSRAAAMFKERLKGRLKELDGTGAVA